LTKEEIAQNFLEEWDGFIMGLVEGAERETDNDAEYKHNQAEYSKAGDELRGMLPEEGKLKLRDYSDLETALAATEIETAYRGGMRDAMKILFSMMGGAEK
jgi:hypothetical protein